MTPKAPSSKKNLSVIEKYLLLNPAWQDGFRDFSKLFGRPDCWLYVVSVNSESKLIHLERKGTASSGRLSSERLSTAHFLKKFAAQWLDQADMQDTLPMLF